MRGVGGWLLVLLGLVALTVGSAVAVAFGTDDTLTVGPHELATTGMAIVTAPGALPYAGPTMQVTVSVERPASTVFVGVGHHVDVRDYLADAAYTRIDKVSLPWRTESTQVRGRTQALTDPADLTWWLTSASATGVATVTFPLPDIPVDVVVTNPERAPGFRTDVTVEIIQKGVFVGALALVIAGVGLVAAGVVVRRGRWRGAHGPAGGSAHTDELIGVS